MRLINVKTICLEEFLDDQLPKYAIVSHTWNTDEVSYEGIHSVGDSRGSPNKHPRWEKIKFACDQAKQDGLHYVWIDTCCIDKKSSAELQQAINSMYRYYASATVCYVYLADVDGACPRLDQHQGEWTGDSKKWQDQFASSRWFYRGWTLQELLAPKDARFFGSRWNFLGRKQELIQTISRITNIDTAILAQSANMAAVSIARRMSWAAYRQTSRVEDQAYCLLGIFNVNMPMLYGEGRKAFIRLQEEILKTSTDHSIFAWEIARSTVADGSLLATSPLDFANASRIVQCNRPSAFQMTNRGLQISLKAISCTTEYPEYLALLNCRLANDLSGTLALRLRKYDGSDEYHAMRGIAPHQPAIVPHNKIQPRSRLSFVAERDVVSVDPESLQITRQYEPERSMVKFWIPMPVDDPQAFRIIKVHPEHLWDMDDMVMHVGDMRLVDKKLVIRGGVVVEMSSGHWFTIVFGFDQLQSGHDDTGTKVCLPGVWHEGRAPRWTLSRYPLQSLVDARYDECSHTLDSCISGSCMKMPNHVHAYDTSRTEKLEARIHRKTMLTETVYEIALSVTAVCELDAVEQMVKPKSQEAKAQPKVLQATANRSGISMDRNAPAREQASPIMSDLPKSVPLAIATNGETAPLGLPLVPFDAGNYSWNASSNEDSTFSATNVLTDTLSRLRL